MSEHTWVQEHVAAHLAGGLDAQEAERLEAHARECPACATALTDARKFDEGLNALFTNAKPSPGLEDRALARLGGAEPARPAFSPRAKKWAGAIAAVLLLGVIGALSESLATGGGLKLPGAPLETADRAPAPSGAVYEARAEQSAHADAERARAEAERRSAEIDRISKMTVDEKVTQDNIRKPFFDPMGTPNRNPDGSYTGDSQSKGFTKGQDVVWNSVDPRPSATTFDPNVLKPSLPAEPTKPGDPKGGEQPDTKPKPDGAPQPKGPNVDPKPADPSANPAPEPVKRIVLRSGEIEFEVDSFDDATEVVTKLVMSSKGGFVGTVNRDKLPSGKVKGSITVRIPPELLDALVLDLRRELGKNGTLQGVKLSSQDVTKMYMDLESRARAARTMEQRLLQIIKDGKGEIEQLLKAEKEVGVWRTKIEELEGEIRYYSNLAAFSTLTVTLVEKEAKAAPVVAVATERERVQAGVEVEDVDKAYQQVLAAVVEAKGRITKSELKQLSAGQFNATFHFEVKAESGGPIRDRLRMLGRVARLEIDRTVQTESGTPALDATPKRGDTVFLVQIYNLANVQPRETATLSVAAVDVPAAYQALRDAVAKTTGRVLVAQLNEQDRQNITAQFEFEVKRTDEAAIRTALDAAGDILSRQVGRAAESDSVTDSKVFYRVSLVAANRLNPRETTTLSVEVPDVDRTATLFGAQVTEVKGRQVDAKLDRDARGQATAKLVFEVPLAAAPGLVERFKGEGTVRVSQSTRDPQATEGKFATARIYVTLTNVEAIVPPGDGLWPNVRQGLSLSASLLLKSVMWIVVGLCVVLPWALLGFGGYRVVRRVVRTTEPQGPAPQAPVAPAPQA